MRRTAMAALFAFGLTAPALAQPATQASPQELRQAAGMLGKEYDQAYNSKTSSAMAALYTHDGILVPPAHAPVEGRTALGVYYQGRFDHGVGHHTIHINQVEPIGEGGLALGRFQVEVRGPGGTMREVGGNLLFVMRHQPQGWKLRLVMASPVPGG